MSGDLQKLAEEVQIPEARLQEQAYLPSLFAHHVAADARQEYTAFSGANGMVYRGI
jgi:hypothetical protein